MENNKRLDEKNFNECIEERDLLIIDLRNLKVAKDRCYTDLGKYVCDFNSKQLKDRLDVVSMHMKKHYDMAMKNSETL